MENLFSAWKNFAKGKMNKDDVLAFSRNLEDNIFELHLDLKDNIYKHGLYNHFFVHDPKKRYISCASVRDRVVHQAAVQIMEPIFEKQFIFDSYSSRCNKGTHMAVERLEMFFRKATLNYRQPVYALKCDIRKFFDSVDHLILKSIIESTIFDEKFLRLLSVIIDSYTYGDQYSKGLPLGNVTSQLFANIYLNRFDHYVKEKLRLKWYMRFCDDFIIVHKGKDYLLKVLQNTRSFLKAQSNLHLHPNKVTIRKFSYGIDFVGQVLRPGYRVLRTKTKRRMLLSVSKRARIYGLGEMNDNQFRQSLQSYIGLIKHGKNFKAKKRLLEEVKINLDLFSK